MQIKPFVYLCFFLSSQVIGQVYRVDQEAPVTVGGQALRFPWVGGINSAQYSTMDVNGDALEDLIIFERTSGKINVFVNEGGQYRYTVDYNDQFPVDLRSWMLLRDFNRDGKKDIFSSDPRGIRVFVNTSEGQGLSWKVFNEDGRQSPLMTIGSQNKPINLQMNSTDIPSITDVDSDGDLDVLVFRFTGESSVEFHKNFSMERSGNADSMQLERILEKWGNFEQCFCDDIAFAGEDCLSSAPGGRVKHQGGKALLTLDLDGDGDHEAVVGEEGCPGLYLLTNEGDLDSANMRSVDTNFPNSINPARLFEFPAAYFEDVDFDGIKDLLVSPNVSSNLNNSIDFESSSWYYKNTGSDETPNFQLIQRNFLQDQMLDFGEKVVPAFIDADGDGDLDMFVSSFLDISAGFRVRVKQFTNTGTAEAPSFTLTNEDFMQLSQGNYINMKIAFEDIDNNGTQDFIFSATPRSAGGTGIFYMLNRSNSRLELDPDVRFLFNLAPNVSNENFKIIDINRDGNQDILVGRSTGRLEYYRNAGSLENPNFFLEIDSFYDFDSSPFRTNMSLDVADIDGDGTMDLVTGDDRGNLTYYSDFLSTFNNPSEGVPLLIQQNEEQDPFQVILGSQLQPRVANLFSEDQPAIVLGTSQGGLMVLRNTGATVQPITSNTVRIYPNPAYNRDMLTVVSPTSRSAFVVALNGQVVMDNIVLQAEEENELSIAGLVDGMYILVTNGSDGEFESHRFIVGR